MFLKFDTILPQYQGTSQGNALCKVHRLCKFGFLVALWLSGIEPVLHPSNVDSILNAKKPVNRVCLSTRKHPREQSDRNTNRG